MSIIRSPTKLYWDVVHNGILIHRAHTKKEAKNMINKLKHLEP